MAIADISFVCSKDKCPNGYEILLNCPCGHHANLWKKFIGAPAEERYLCFSRESKDGKIIEDMYIPGSSERYVMKGFEVVKRTIEGEDSLNCKYLAIKRTPKASAKNGVSDITVYKCKDKPPAEYKKLGAKLNGLYICVKIEPIENISTAPPTSQESSTHPIPTESPNYPPPARIQKQASEAQAPPTNNSSYRLQEKSLSYDSQTVPENRSYVPPPSAHSNVYSHQGPPLPQATYPPRGPPVQSYPPRGPPVQSYTPRGPPAQSYPPREPPAQSTYTAPFVSPPATSYSSSATVVGGSRTGSGSDQNELLLGFEHLDLDQPIEFEQKGVFEDSPPDSPVDEHFTVEASDNLTSSAPLPPSNQPHPPSSSYYPNQPQYGYPPRPPVPQYRQPPFPGSGQYYGAQAPPGPGHYYGTQGPSGPGQYYQTQAPPRPGQYPQTQGYPPPYNPNHQSKQPPGSSNIGFNVF